MTAIELITSAFYNDFIFLSVIQNNSVIYQKLYISGIYASQKDTAFLTPKDKNRIVKSTVAFSENLDYKNILFYGYQKINNNQQTKRFFFMQKAKID